MPKKSRRQTCNSNSKKQQSKNNNNNNKQSLERMKMEIANDFGVKLGGDSSSKENGRVGGEMVRRLMDKALCDNSKRSSK